MEAIEQSYGWDTVTVADGARGSEVTCPRSQGRENGFLVPSPDPASLVLVLVLLVVLLVVVVVVVFVLLLVLLVLLFLLLLLLLILLLFLLLLFFFLALETELSVPGKRFSAELPAHRSFTTLVLP